MNRSLFLYRKRGWDGEDNLLWIIKAYLRSVRHHFHPELLAVQLKDQRRIFKWQSWWQGNFSTRRPEKDGRLMMNGTHMLHQVAGFEFLAQSALLTRWTAKERVVVLAAVVVCEEIWQAFSGSITGLGASRA
jgi:hypothetical protein